MVLALVGDSTTTSALPDLRGMGLAASDDPRDVFLVDLRVVFLADFAAVPLVDLRVVFLADFAVVFLADLRVAFLADFAAAFLVDLRVVFFAVFRRAFFFCFAI